MTEAGPNTDGVAAQHVQTASVANGQAGAGDRAGEPASRRDLTWLWLVLLTALAACLRFAGIGYQPLWVDEAAVYWRTCGSYQQLLEILQNDGFAPLHYEFYWVLRHFVTLTPSVMRSVPALAAVLMVPAMYFLARQLVARRVALVVAAFTAVSGLIGWHAHDAKMYMHLWLFCTLSMACLLWWIRGGVGVAWWSWVAASTAAVGLHSLGWGVIALQPLVFFTWPPRWKRMIIFVLGLMLIGIGPACYYLNFNRWTRNIHDRGWDASGIAWIDQNNAQLSAQDLAVQTGMHFLFGYEFPPPMPQGVLRWTWQAAMASPVVLVIALLAGVFPWPTRARRRAEAAMPLARWRSCLYLAAWALLPPYAFYCASSADYAWPHQLLGAAAAAVCRSGWMIAVAVTVATLAFYVCAPDWRERRRRLLAFMAVTVALLLIATGIALALATRPPGSLWISRYIAFAWPAVAIGAFALIMRLPLAPVRWLVISVILAVNLAICVARTQWLQAAPTHLLAADVVAARDQAANLRVAFLFWEAQGKLMPVEGRYYLYLFSGEKTYPSEFAGGDVLSRFAIPRASTTRRMIESLRQGPRTDRLIVWDKLPAPPNRTPTSPDVIVQEPATDDLLVLLPGKWTRVSSHQHPYYTRWGWGLQGNWRRREYIQVREPE